MTDVSIPFFLQIFGKKDTHVPPQGRDLIRKTLHDAGVTFSFYEPAWAQHAFIRDELSKYVVALLFFSPNRSILRLEVQFADEH
jgi:dienelactone hydrolase